jgi:hypothetical protein
MRLFTVLFVIALATSPALADSAAIPAVPKDWGTFIRGGLIAAGLYILALIAGRLWIAWRQRRAKSSGN